MKCLSCGHCCKTMSPINFGYCPLLAETQAKTGVVYHCSDYENRPKECKDHTYPAEFCPVGMNTLALVNKAMAEARLLDVSSILSPKPVFPF